MLKKEVDYVPQSPKKPQLSHLGRGPSGLRPKAPAERSRPTTPSSGLRVRPRERDPLLSSTSTTASSAADTDGDAPDARRTPAARPRASLHARGLSTSSISVSSVATPPAHGLPPLPTTPARQSAKSREKLRAREPPLPGVETPKPASAAAKLHRRAQSLADLALDAAPGTAKGSSGPRSASSPGASAGATPLAGKKGPRTMAEKKEILGTMLGNVDALVEGVKKAGVWGLS